MATCWGIVVVVPRGAVTRGATLLPEVTIGTIVLPEVTRGNIVLPEVTRGNTLLPEVTRGNTLLPEVTRGNTVLTEVTRGNTVLPEEVTGGTTVFPEEVFRVVVAVGVVRDDGVWSERTLVAVKEVVFIGERDPVTMGNRFRLCLGYIFHDLQKILICMIRTAV